MLAYLLFGLNAAVSASAADAPAKAEFRPEILADFNRDGVVDAADRAGKNDWTAELGAILLPNIGDRAKRCPGAANTRFTDAQLEACHDAQGDVARAPEYFAPLRLSPLAGLSNAAVGHVAALDPRADRIRIFIQRKRHWAYLAPTDRLSAAELKAGVRLGVDARDVVRDAAAWDGRTTISFSISDRGRTAEDHVVMQVAPVIIHNHLQKAVEVFAPMSGEFAAHTQFIKDLSAALPSAGIAGPIYRIDTFDLWAQDFVEFGYVSMPGPNGRAVVLRIAIRSPQPDRAAGRALFDLRGPGMGIVQIGGKGYHQVDSFGNLETVPPYQLNGRRYPVGRVIYGDAGDGISPHRDMTTFFESQRVQAPIVLDTSWLAIGHVDEFVQFLPANNARGWTIAIKDVAAGLAVLREAQRAGHGLARAFSHDGAPVSTIDQVLADREWLEDNELARRKVQLNLNILLAETGVAEQEVIRVPGLFEQSSFSAFVEKARQPASENSQSSSPPPLPEGLTVLHERIVYGPGTLIALYPAAVNGLLIDGHNYIVPKQWGPVIDGTDIMEAAVRSSYQKLGIRSWSIDDWLSHHQIGGEIHCGTNVTREVGAAWWR